MSKESIITFDKDKCVACHGCVISCKTWRELEIGVHYRKVRRIWDGAYPSVQLSHVSVNCQHCTAPACLSACPAGAIRKQPEDGRVTVDQSICIGCHACEEACPYHVPAFEESGLMQKCDLCAGRTGEGEEPPCVATCPTRALTMESLDPADKAAHEAAMLDLVRLADRAVTG